MEHFCGTPGLVNKYFNSFNTQQTMNDNRNVRILIMYLVHTPVITVTKASTLSKGVFEMKRTTLHYYL